jgi:hypothetical protein
MPGNFGYLARGPPQGRPDGSTEARKHQRINIWIQNKPAAGKRWRDYLGIAFTINPDGANGGHPLWILPWCDDRLLRARLQQAFPDNMVWDGDDFHIGLPLDIPADATEAWIVEEGNKLADRIIGVLAP